MSKRRALSPMHRSTWRTRWDELTRELEQELRKEELDVQRVAGVLAERQGLLMIPAPGAGEEGLAGDAELESWIRAAQEIEKRIDRQGRLRHEGIARALASLQQNASVRGRFGALSGEPRAASQLFDREL